MKVLITGGAGFIGSSLTQKLVADGARVTVLDNLSPQVHGANSKESPLLRSLPKTVHFVHGDVRDRASMERAIDGQDVIVHLAAETGTGQSMYEIDRYVDVNIRGTSILLDIIEKQRPGVERIVVASSRSIYGEGKYRGTNGFVYPNARSEADMNNGLYECQDPDTGEMLTCVPTDEHSLIHPSSIYGITKQVQEQLVLTACQSMNIGAIALRYQNVYGPGQSLKNPYTGILSIFSTQLLQGEKVNIFEDGNESRDFVFIDDAVEATILAIRSPISGRAYNVGSGKKTSVLTVAKTLKHLYNSTAEIEITGSFRIGDIRHNVADLARIRNDLGFEPKTIFSDGAFRFSQWVLSQQPEASSCDKALHEMRKRGMLK